MRTFKFEIILTEQDLEGDEFWEQALERDGTGIADLTDALVSAIEDSNLMVGSARNPKDVVKLIGYTER